MKVRGGYDENKFDEKKENDKKKKNLQKGRPLYLINNLIKNKNVSVSNRTLITNRFSNLSKKERFDNGKIGLVNIGNTCYLNSALQNLKNIDLLTHYLLSNYINYDKDRFTFKYCELIANLINQDKNNYIKPTEFFSKFTEFAPIFRFGEQNDSNICIMYILSLLEKETRNFEKKKCLKKLKLVSRL